MDLRPIYALGFVLVLTVAMLLLLQAAQHLVSSLALTSDLRSDNPAQRLLRVGQILGVSILATSAVRSSANGEALVADILWVAAFAFIGLFLSAVTWEIGIRLLLQKGLLVELQRGNQAAGIAGGAQWIATALVTSRAIGGRGVGEIGLSLVFFLVAQVALYALVSLFRTLTTYDDAEQIHGDNRAAALSYGGMIVALAILVGQAVEGEFVGWSASLLGFARALATVFLLYPIRQVVVQVVLLRGPFTLRGGALDRAISIERSETMGALEAAAYLATALAVSRLAS